MYKSGDFFKGEFLDDKQEGFGTFYESASQELYVGQFQANIRQGEALLIKTESVSMRFRQTFFMGNFKANKQDGPG
jgi:hypothetical protein